MGGRFTARTDESFAVFVMGVRVNRVFAFREWVGVMSSLRSMLRELRERPGTGFLGGHTHFCWRGVTLFQYWRSYEDLENYSRNPNEAHMPGWQKFNRRVRKGGAVGLWHEAYLVGPGCYEAVYADVPVSGLARATKHIPAFGGKETRRRRRIRSGTVEAGGEPGSETLVPESVGEVG
ncbi:MAG: DUF4188 domain-containing protein [Rubrobacter sp.]|nr:DUF4188 domain-containing protein [Rubrobacter sp.]